MNAHNEQSSVVEKVAAEMREFYDAEMAPDDDVLKSWIDRLAAQPSPVVKQNLTTQPAAAQESAPWRDHDAAIDAKALSTATEIALMWGQDRSQFISRIQVAVIDAMRWVKGGLQTAAAQEAVGWQWRWLDTDNTWSEWADGGSRKEIDARIACWKADGEDHRMQVRPVFAAPVTAAPADLIERCREILAWQRTGVLPGNALREYAKARWPDEHDPLQIAEKETAREAFRILARAAAASTPAAPGIDLAPFHALHASLVEQADDAELNALEADSIGLDDAAKRSDATEKVLRRVAGELNALLIDSSPNGGSDPWRGLYAPERAPNRDEYGCFYHPDIPSWDDEREESIAPLLKAQGFDLQCVPGDFSYEAMEEGGERYWQEMREWNPEPEGDGWRLVAIYDTEDGPYSMFVKPLAQAGDAEVQP